MAVYHIDTDLVMAPVAAATFGFVSGAMSGSHLSSRQFLAENAHRQPTTVQGWYFYQKTKNYRVMWGGISQGFKTGARLGMWTAAFVALSEGLGEAISQASVLSDFERPPHTKAIEGGLAGSVIASLAGSFYRLSRAGRRRRLMLGVGLGAIAGGARDLRNYLKARLPESQSSTPA